MKQLLIVHLLIFIAISSQAQESEDSLIHNSFDRYKTSILNDKGEDAVNYVDSRTIRYYSEILETTKNADSTQVDSLGIMDKLMVFSIRHKASEEEILSFDGKSLLIYAIKEGMVGKNSVANNTIGEIKIDSAFAKAQFISRGKETPFYFHFYKEEGVWKIDLTSLFAVSSMAFDQIMKESGMSENEYIFMLLEIVSGKKPSSDIWDRIE